MQMSEFQPTMLLLLGALGWLLLFTLSSCVPNSTPATLPPTPTLLATITHQSPSTDKPVSSPKADVTAVIVSGNEGKYQFSVQIQSPDTGCDQYADWWEVVSLDGDLIYRRVLLHSHTDEQPFTRSGGPVAILADQNVWVRAHMAPGGYGGQAFRGSVSEGFSPASMDMDFARNLETLPPLPENCAF